MRTDLDFTSRGTRCSAWHYRADDDALNGPGGRPCVVMGHGFGATKDAGLEPFAERFAAAGMDVLVFDYRGYGTSDGALRQNVNHLHHRQDYRAALAAARAIDGVDPRRVALWGSSYSGGHVVSVGAKDRKVRAVVSQGAAMDGLAAVLMIWGYAGLGQLLKLTGHALRDVGRAVRRKEPHLIPVVGPPGSLAAISAEGAEVGYKNIMGPTFRNEMCARGIIPILVNRPVTSAGRLHCPILVVVAEHDNIAPTAAVRRAAAKAADRAQVLAFDCGHFDIYVGDIFERSVATQVEFLAKALAD